VSEVSDKYRRAAMAARSLAHKAPTPEAQARWLQRAEDWEQKAKEADPSSNSNNEKDAEDA
jgi:hypothetical protein